MVTTKLLIKAAVIIIVLNFGCVSMNPLIQSVKKGRLDRVKNCIKYGEDVDTIDRFNKRTPLIYAAYYRNRAILEYLVKRCSNLDHQDKDGFTALNYAAYYGDFNSVKVLIEFGANANIQNYKGYTPLDYAKYYEWTNIESYLESHLAKIENARRVKNKSKYVDEDDEILLID